MCSHVVLQIIILFLLIFFLWTLFIYNVPYEIHILNDIYGIPNGTIIYLFIFGPNIYYKLTYVTGYTETSNAIISHWRYVKFPWYELLMGLIRRLLQNGQVVTIAMNYIQFDLQHNVCMPTIDSQQYIDFDFLIVLQLW